MCTHDVAALIAPDATNSGAYVRELARHGFSTVAVLPSGEGDVDLSSASKVAQFEHLVTHSGTLRRTIKSLRSANVSVVLPGSTSGIELAERLALYLGIHGNCPCTSELRWNRGIQAAALAGHGVPSVRILRTTDSREAVKWAHEFERTVVLPADVGLSALATVCKTGAEIREVFETQKVTLRAQNSFNRDLVAQEYCNGNNYIAHSVSFTGTNGAHHCVTQLWSETPMGCRRHGHSRLIPDSPIRATISQLVSDALDALGVTSGYARTCVIDTPDRGPVVTSVYPIANCSLADAAILRYTGTNPIYDAVRAMINPWMASLPTAKATEEIIRVTLNFPRHGGALDPKLLSALMSLPTVMHLPDWLTAATKIPRSAVANPPEILLGGSKESVTRDLITIRACEEAGLYVGDVSVRRPPPGRAISGANLRRTPPRTRFRPWREDLDSCPPILGGASWLP